jgi:hypothetical protein
MQNSSANTEGLRALLEQLFPDVAISSKGVALLAAQLAELENGRDDLDNRFEHRSPIAVLADDDVRTMRGTAFTTNDSGSSWANQ